MANGWIKAATAGGHGQFRKKAEAAGKTTAEYASEKADAPGKTGQQARLAETLMGLHHNRARRAGETAKPPKETKSAGRAAKRYGKKD